ncbi:MAG: DNA gyrase subunit A, partial [Deltaproteobacteria bacterium]|nr:DNA gyrase subunit A [Deltaproteobacteria bacterium]
LIVKELEEVKTAYASPRRTDIIDDYSDIEMEDLIEEEDMVVTVTSLGYIKRTQTSEYRAQHRGGKGLAGMDTRDDDFVAKLFIASTHANVLIFSDTGKVYCKKIYQIPQGGRTARGKAIVNFVGMDPGEKIAAVLPVREFTENSYVVTVTRRGYVKKTDLMAYSQIRQTGIIGVVIDEGDSLIGAAILTEGDHLMLGTSGGQSIRFDGDTQIRGMGRQSRGVRGIEVRRPDGEADDEVVGMAVVRPNTDEQLLTITENGYGKRTRFDEYRLQNRGGSGLLTVKRSEKTGKVVAVLPVHENEHLMLITNVGKIIRMEVNTVSTLGRNTQGVRLIRMNEGEFVICVERLAEDEDADTPSDASPASAAPDTAEADTAPSTAEAETAPSDTATDNAPVEEMAEAEKPTEE